MLALGCTAARPLSKFSMQGSIGEGEPASQSAQDDDQAPSPVHLPAILHTGRNSALLTASSEYASAQLLIMCAHAAAITSCKFLVYRLSVTVTLGLSCPTCMAMPRRACLPLLMLLKYTARSRCAMQLKFRNYTCTALCAVWPAS